MNERVKSLSEAAGFVFWKKESWGPGPGHIDWSCKYDSELEQLVKLVVLESAEWINANVGHVTAEAKQELVKHFGVE